MLGSRFAAACFEYGYDLRLESMAPYRDFFPNCPWLPDQGNFRYRVLKFINGLTSKIPGNSLQQRLWLQHRAPGCLIEEAIQKKPPRKNVWCLGWRFHSHLVPKFREEILKAFAPSEDTLNAVRKWHQQNNPQGRPLVAIHCRRGDYAQFNGGRFFYSWETYHRLILDLAHSHHWQNALFVLFSNETPPREIFTDIPWISGPGKIMEDMTAMSQCQAIIGPPSSFSLWASFAGKVPYAAFKEPPQFLPPEEWIPFLHDDLYFFPRTA